MRLRVWHVLAAAVLVSAAVYTAAWCILQALVAG